MNLIVPRKGPPIPVELSKALTFLPSANNQVYYYFGDANEALQHNRVYQTAYTNEKLREIISGKKKSLTERGINPDELFVCIKPDKLCNYKNVVDLLDEMIIHDVKRYALTEPDAADAEIIKKVNGEHY